MSSIASLLPGSTFTIKKKTDSELYLPKWVRTKPEDMLKAESDQKPKKRMRKRRNQRCNLYTLRGILDDKIMQKLEEAEWLSSLIKRSMNGVLSKKLKLKALRKTVCKGLGEYEIESEEEITYEQQVHSSKKKPDRKNNKERFERKQLFRDRLRWERMNEWNKPPPTDKAENDYSQNFLTYLSQVKLPGRKQNLNELENLYKTYQQVVTPKPNRAGRRKIRTKSNKLVSGISTNSRGNRSQLEGAVMKKREKNEEGASSENDLEANHDEVEGLSWVKTRPLPTQKRKFTVKPSSSKEIMNNSTVYSTRTKKKPQKAEEKNNSETSLKLREKLSLTTVFQRKATLLSLTTVKNKRPSVSQRKASSTPLESSNNAILLPDQRKQISEILLNPMHTSVDEFKPAKKKVTFETPLSINESFDELPKYVFLKIKPTRNFKK